MTSSVTNLGANASRRYIEVNSGKANTATEQLSSGLIVSNPSYDPSASAVGYNLSANIQSLQQASRNVTQATAVIQLATGFLGATSDVLIRMKQLTVAANSDSVGPAQRQMMNNEFQQLLKQVDLNAINARWGGASLFTGGAGAVTNPATQAASAMVGGGASAPTAYTSTYFTGFVANHSQGMINGTATEATVQANGALFNVSVKIGDQTFTGVTDGQTTSANVVLTSTSNSANTVSFSIKANFGTAAATQSDFQQFLGIGNGANATFSSVNTAAGIAGVTMTAGAGTTSGNWALSYNVAGAVGTFSLSNGVENYTATVTAGNPISQNVTFNNGVNLALNAFNGSANIAQSIYNVAQGTSITQNFQYAEKSTDTLSVTFSGANVAALGLSNLDILTTSGAAIASAAIDIAQQQIGSQIGALGGKASEFKFMSDTLRINIQNTMAAKATFTDADIAQSMQDLQTFSGLGQIAQSVFTKALNDQSNMVQMVQSVR